MRACSVQSSPAAGGASSCSSDSDAVGVKVTLCDGPGVSKLGNGADDAARPGAGGVAAACPVGSGPLKGALALVAPAAACNAAGGDVEQGSLPHDSGVGGMTITLQGVSCTVGRSRRRTSILSDISAYFEAGRLTALMGPSGSGKTTLLNIAAGRQAGRDVTGDVRYAGTAPTPAFLRRFTGYVEQFDTLIPMLTVREMLAYTAALKTPHAAPAASRAAAVNELLRELDLVGCADVRIGDRLRKGISGGQAKRVNIGIALIGQPRVLFLDEPTSGLDSTAAAEVVAVIARLADGGVTAVATVHSPTARAYEKFHRILMLLGGRIVYFGETGPLLHTYATESLLPLIDIGGGGGVSLGALLSHEAEALADAVSRAERLGRGAQLAAAYQASPAAATAAAVLVRLRVEGASGLSVEAAKALHAKCSTVTPWWWALAVLLRYRTARNWADPLFLGPRVVDKIAVCGLLAALYWGVGDKFVFFNLSNMSAFLFMWVALPCFSAAAYLPALVLERGLFARERDDGLYQVSTYLAAKMVDELLPAAPLTLAAAAFVWHGVRLVGSFWLFWSVYYITLAVGVGMAYFIAAAAPSMDAANALLPTYAITLLLFGGQLMTFQVMAGWMRWYSAIDVLTYSWGALVINQFEHHPKKFVGGQTMLQFYCLDGKTKWGQAGYAALFFPAFLLLTWATLRTRRYRR